MKFRQAFWMRKNFIGCCKNGWRLITFFLQSYSIFEKMLFIKFFDLPSPELLFLETFVLILFTPCIYLVCKSYFNIYPVLVHYNWLRNNFLYRNFDEVCSPFVDWSIEPTVFTFYDIHFSNMNQFLNKDGSMKFEQSTGDKLYGCSYITLLQNIILSKGKF